MVPFERVPQGKQLSLRLHPRISYNTKVMTSLPVNLFKNKEKHKKFFWSQKIARGLIRMQNASKPGSRVIFSNFSRGHQKKQCPREKGYNSMTL